MRTDGRTDRRTWRRKWELFPTIRRHLRRLCAKLSGAASYNASLCSFLGAVAELRKATLSFVMPVSSSVRLSAWNNSAPTGRIFMKFDIWIFFESLSRKFKFHYNLIRITVTLHENRYTRWFKYDRDWFVCKQAALRSSCATLREWSHNLHPPSCSG